LRSIFGLSGGYSALAVLLQVNSLPKRVHGTSAWRTAIQVPLLVGENGGPAGFRAFRMEVGALYP
jgi:hypothetical protein